MDSRQTEAARRLAHGFAEEHEWDLVEVVARRTIDGEGGLEGGVNAVVPGRYQPLNAWAWKALGVVELVGTTLSACLIYLTAGFRIVSAILKPSKRY